MTVLRMDVDQVKALAGQIKSIHDNDVTSLLSTLNSLNDQLNSAWDGSAQAAFYERYGNWVRELDQFTDTLYSVCQYLNSVADNYIELDQAARAAAMSAGN
ncbi:MAG: WXG100 family type VII secretion target [Anaerolineales bacterium]